MSYRITAEELAELQKRVLLLADRVHSACLEKIATFCGANAMRKDLPEPPTLSEPVLQNLPPPPTDPQEFGKWAQSLSELAEQRVTRPQSLIQGLCESWGLHSMGREFFPC